MLYFFVINAGLLLVIEYFYGLQYMFTYFFILLEHFFYTYTLVQGQFSCNKLSKHRILTSLFTSGVSSKHL